MVPGASASVFVVSTITRKEMWIDFLIVQEPFGDACNLRLLIVPTWKRMGSVPDNPEASE